MSKYKKYAIEDLFGGVIGFECREKDIKLLECEKSQADVIIIKHHYSHKPTSNSFASFVVLYEGVVSGALQLGYGIRPHIKGIYDYNSTREFDRMWLSDNMPKYSETIVISLLIHYIKRKYPNIKYLISYADTSVGNEGTIYKASNAKLIDSIKCDFYILPNGDRVHPVSMWHRHNTRAWDRLKTIYPGIIKPDGKQNKYLYTLR